MFTYADTKEYKYSINNLLDKIIKTGENQSKNIDDLRADLHKDHKINKKNADNFKILYKKYNSYTHLLNSMIINQNSYTLSHDNKKINRLLEIEKKLTASWFLLLDELDESLAFSKNQPDDIRYVVSRILPRFIEAPSLLASKEQIDRNKKIWVNYKSIFKSLFHFELFLRKIARGENVSCMQLNINYYLFLLTTEQSIFNESVRTIDEDHEFYSMMIKTIINQYNCIYEQAIALESKKYRSNIQKIISTCENIFDLIGQSDDFIIKENEKKRYINALKISGKVIVPETTNR